jgi:diguanylate cyclase (GGDEF)-like protein/PAS domain S-box-containing protein
MFSNVITDISEQKAIEQALRTSEAKYRQLFEGALDGISVADVETGELLDCNPALCRMVGRSRQELIGQPQWILHNPDEIVGQVSNSFHEHRSDEQGKIMSSQLITSAGKLVDVEIMANTVELGGRKALQAVFRDVMEKKRAEEALYEEKERAQVTLHSIGDAVITTDDNCRIDYLNPVAEKLTGWSLEKASSRPLDEVFQIHDDKSAEPLDNLVRRCIQEGRVIHIARNTVLRGCNGNEYDIDESAAPIRRVDGRILGAVLVFHDVSESRRLARKMAYDAAHDPLTGLINRREFETRLTNALESAKKYGSRHALCYIDLDQFKIVNDTAGHEAGDVLLKQIKNLLDSCFREHDTLARLGGDEFGLLLDNCPIDRAISIAGMIVSSIREYRFVWKGRGYQIGASVGIAAVTRDTESVAVLLSHADVACYTAKELGRNQVHVYHENEGASVQRHVEILQAAGLRDALEMQRFRLFCQPIVPLQGNESEALHYELLLRLEDEEGTLVLPGAFIPAAERYNLMTELDRWVIQTAFQNYPRVLAGRNVRISVNLSGNSLNDESLLEFVSRQFDEFSVPPDRVCFEITETAAVTDLSRAGRFIFEIQKLGCQLALDDFGSGLSSLRYLKALPVDFLKIDSSFIRDIDRDSGNQAIVAAVNQLAHRLGIRTIAEYAVNRQVIEALRKLDIDFAQGYALGAPMPFTVDSIDTDGLSVP